MPSLNGVRVPVVDSGTTTDPQLYVSVGLTQLSGVSLTQGAAIGVYLQAQINATSLTNTTRRPVFFSVVLEADSGNDYWYDYANSAWTDFGSALNAGYQDPNDADWAVGVLSKVELRPRQVADIIMEMPSLPTAGKVRISLYNVVETQVLSPEEITHVTWYRARLAVLGGNDEEALSTRTIATDTSSVHNRYRPEATFWTGEGPTPFHDSRITYASGASDAANWQVGAYPASPTAGHTASGDSLDKLHGAVILASRYTPLKRVRATIKIDSGSLWPHQPLKYGSDYYSIINMEQDVARCQYTVEATEVISPSVTDSIITEGLTSAPGVPGLGGGGATFYVPAISRSHIYMAAIEGDLDDVDDGTTYSKVLATDITAGHVTVASLSGDLDDIDDGSTYGKILATALSSGAALLSQAVGDLDDIGDGTTYGKVNVTAISAGNILLAQATGDLDDIADGTYGKVLSTSISAGKILLNQTDGDLDDIDNGSTFLKWPATGAPPATAVPSGSGLFLGTDKLGFYTSSTWKTYMDSSGNFYLGGASGPFVWTESTSTASIAGWTLDANAIYIGTEVADDTYTALAGEITIGAGFIGAKEFKIAADGTATFKGTLSAATGTLGGWTIDANAIYIGTEVADDTYTAAGHLTLGAGFLGSNQFKIAADGTATFKGDIYANGALVVDGGTGDIQNANLTALGITGTLTISGSGDIAVGDLSISTSGIVLAASASGGYNSTNTVGFLGTDTSNWFGMYATEATATSPDTFNAIIYNQATSNPAVWGHADSSLDILSLGADIFIRSYQTGSSASILLEGDVPSVTVAGTLKNSTGDYYYAGGTDVAVADGGTNLSSYTAGDILYASGTTTLAKLAKGSDGEVLTLASGVPTWAAASSGDITGVTAGTLLDGGGTSGSVTLDVDLTELSEGGTMVGTDWVVVVDGGAQRYVEWQNVPISILSGYTANWDTAYGWGDHSAAGYGTGDVTLAGTQTFTGAKTFDDGLTTSFGLTAAGGRVTITQSQVKVENTTAGDETIILKDDITVNGTSVSLAGHTHTVSNISDITTAATGITKVGTIVTGSWAVSSIGLNKGGTGQSLSDPGADRIMFWDDSASGGAGAVTWLTAGTGLDISTTNLIVDSSSGAAGVTFQSRTTDTTITADQRIKLTIDGVDWYIIAEEAP